MARHLIEVGEVEVPVLLSFYRRFSDFEMGTLYACRLTALVVEARYFGGSGTWIQSHHHRSCNYRRTDCVGGRGVVRQVVVEDLDYVQWSHRCLDFVAWGAEAVGSVAPLG